MRNYIILFLALALAVSQSSCKKWLEVQPASQMSEDQQFGSEDGFKDALIGVYQKMSEPSLYGREMTYGFLDVLAQNYTNVSGSGSHLYMYEGRYSYNDANVQASIAAIWGDLYGSIAQANYILTHVDEKKGVFTGDNYELVKGEALALRAFCHFDLLRLFAPNSLNNPAATAIPYMKLFTVAPQSSLTVQQVLEACLQDLIAAEDLLIVDKQGSVAGSDVFVRYRKNRMNYWAVKGLMARIYLYMGNIQSAYENAKEIIDGNAFRFLNISDLDGSSAEYDRTATAEHLFAIYVSNLRDLTDALFKTPVANGAINSTLLISPARKAELFQATADIRVNPLFWSDNRGIIYYSKLWQDENSAELLKRRIPLMKLSEMYLIAAETAPTLEERITYFNLLRDARIDALLPDNTNEATLKAAIDKEYRKDFICEGQLFFYYKRKNVEYIPGDVTGPMTDAKYVFPKPVQEIEFGK